MTAIDFPNNPSVNDTFTVNTITWKWTGTTWDLVINTPAGAQGDTGPQGPQGSQGPQGPVPTSLTINAKTDSYTVAIGDEGEIVEMGKATAQTLTVPTNTTAAFAIGTQITIIQTGAGQVTIAGADGTVTVNATPGLKLRAQWSSATLIKRNTNTWVAVGDLVA
jgi:hypothetical protein